MTLTKPALVDPKQLRLELAVGGVLWAFASAPRGCCVVVAEVLFDNFLPLVGASEGCAAFAPFMVAFAPLGGVAGALLIRAVPSANASDAGVSRKVVRSFRFELED